MDAFRTVFIHVSLLLYFKPAVRGNGTARDNSGVRERERARGGSMPRGGFVLSRVETYHEPAADIDRLAGGSMIGW